MATFHKPSDAELRKQLTPEQYQVTQHEGTEPPWERAIAGGFDGTGTCPNLSNGRRGRRACWPGDG